MRRTQAMAALVGMVGGILFVVAPAASAQTGYPPGPCTAISGSQDVGEVSIGQQFVLQLAPTCLFTPGTPLAVTVNGVDIPGKTAEPNGFALVDITVVSATQLSIDDPVLTPAICGTNTVTARGASPTAAGGFATQVATFRINCPGAAGTTTSTPGRGGLLSRTGVNSLGYVAAALALVAAGSMFLVVSRRRRAS